MNSTTLFELINRYEDNMPLLYDNEHDELFKWNALKTFQSEWFAPAEKYPDFISRFKAATKDFSVLIDNSRMHSRNGTVKLYEKDPIEVQRLFLDVLFADDQGDLELRQSHIEEFLVGMEELRKKYYPAYYSFKQDRHSAMTYLAMYAPSENYMYKYSEAEAMAVYSEFGFDIGAGASFSLKHYYAMCDEIVQALKEHRTVQASHEQYLQDIHMKDTSLHLLAFDLMYCCRTYQMYHGIKHQPKKASIKDASEAAQKKAEQEELQAAANDLRTQIEDLELSLPDVFEISLLGVDVTLQPYGVGTVIWQELNQIKVQFHDATKMFILDAKYSWRPKFENDEVILEEYKEYFRIQNEIISLRKRLNALEAKMN